MASANLGASEISGRYATAVFDLATDQGAIDAVSSDLNEFKVMLESSSDLQRLVRSLILSREDRAAAIAALSKAAKFSQLTSRFLAVVARNRRLSDISDIIHAFFALVAKDKGEINADVTSATALSKDQITSLTAALKEAAGTSVNLDLKVDPDLIGGLVVKIGSTMVDSSLRTKLSKLQLAMKGVV